MSVLKVGDKVRVSNNLDATKGKYGLDLLGKMMSMRNKEYIVSEVFGYGKVRISCDSFSTFSFDVSDISSTTLIDALINGKTIENPIQYGIKGGIFAGYLVKFGETHYVSIDAKGIAQLTFNKNPIVPNETQFVVTQEKTKFHTIAFKLAGDDNWYINKVSDAELVSRESTFTEYKILESWEKIS